MLASATITVPDWLLPGLILLVLGAALTWLVRVSFHAFRDSVEGWFQSILKEVKPNGGNTDSLGDQVLQVKEAVKQVQGEQETVRENLAAFNGTFKDTLGRVETGVAGLYPRIESVEAEQARVRDLMAKDSA